MIGRRQEHDRRGAAVVEMALVLPVFFMVILGIVEFGWAMMASHLMTTAARDAGRIAIMDGSTNAQVEQSVKTFLQSALGVDAGDVTVTISVNDAPGQLASSQEYDTCTVHIEVPFDKVSLIKGDYLSGASLKGECMMQHQ